jgi:c-di-GMP-binding flagellar brake protein YcgR
MQQPSSGPRARVFAIGARIEIGYIPTHGVGSPVDTETRWLASRLEDQDDSGQLLTVAWPTDVDRRLIPTAPGDVLQVAASTRSDALYSARATVEAVISGAVPLLGLRVSGEWQREQRRSAVRVDVAIRPRIAAKITGEAFRDVRLALTNISAAGVQVRSRDELRPGDLLELAFELMGVDDELQLTARVRRVHRYERVWDAGCEFENLPDRLAKRIVQFIFGQQRAAARARQS